ncbi:MAG: 50S ribosomal protein L18 [Acidobacteria bacterium]|nr:50S ribosomal protein L18 [Acidobacteriota bacterium]
MIQQQRRNETRRRIHNRIRRKVRGEAARPRLVVFRSQKHIYAQVVDDLQGHTLVAAGSTAKDFSGKNGGTVASAKEVGKLLAQRAQEKGIRQVAFDRGGYQYHGRVKALADAARQAGLQF